MPTSMPAARAADCASASCSSHSHCNQQWNSMRSASLVRCRATYGASGVAARVSQRALRSPNFSVSAHHNAKSVSASPPAARNASNSACRAGLRGTRNTCPSTSSLARNAVSRSMRLSLRFDLANFAAYASSVLRCLRGRNAASRMFSTRR